MVNAIFEPQRGDSIDWIIRGFSRAVDKAEVLKEAKRRNHFIPKSQRRKSKQNRAKARRQTSWAKATKAARYGIYA
jgi:ribosomal protein S21